MENTKNIKGKVIYLNNRPIFLPYTDGPKFLIDMEVLKDKKMSMGAKALAIFIYTLPKNWKLSVTHLANHFNVSRNTIAKYLREFKDSDTFHSMQIRINMHDVEPGIYEVSQSTLEVEKAAEKMVQEIATDTNKQNIQDATIVSARSGNRLVFLCFNPYKKDSKFEQKSDQKNAQNLSTILKDKSFKKKVQLELAKNDFEEPPLFRERTSFWGLKDPKYEKNKQQALTLQDKPKKTRKVKKPSIDYLTLFTPQEVEFVELWLKYKSELQGSQLKSTQQDFQIRKIHAFKQQGEDIIKIISQSLDRNYKGLFSVKEYPKPPFYPAVKNTAQPLKLTGKKLPSYMLGAKAKLRIWNEKLL